MEFSKTETQGEDIPVKDQMLQDLFQDIKPIAVPYVLVVESDPAVANVLESVLKEAHIPAMFANTGRDARLVTKGLQPLLFLINTHLPDGDGLELYDQLCVRRNGAPAIILSTWISRYRQQLEERGLLGMDIPVDIDDLAQTVISLLPSQIE